MSYVMMQGLGDPKTSEVNLNPNRTEKTVRVTDDGAILTTQTSDISASMPLFETDFTYNVDGDLETVKIYASGETSGTAKLLTFTYTLGSLTKIEESITTI